MLTFCKALSVFYFLFAVILHLKHVISLQSVIGHKTKIPLPAIVTERGYAPERLWLQRKAKNQVCFL